MNLNRPCDLGSRTIKVEQNLQREMEDDISGQCGAKQILTNWFKTRVMVFTSLCIYERINTTIPLSLSKRNPSSFSCFQNILSQPKLVGASTATLRSCSRVALPSRCVTFALASESWLPQLRTLAAHSSTAPSCPFWTASPTSRQSSTPSALTTGTVSL